ncbi:MAG: YraN family protein [Prevotella sp.]
MAEHNELGTWGEQLAARFLEEKGYTVVERDWRLGKRDIDIIALTPDGVTTVFVEVKTRSSDIVAKPEDAIDRNKVRSIGYAANAYVKEHVVLGELRFDTVTIVGRKDSKNLRVEHVEDAFNPLLFY